MTGWVSSRLLLLVLAFAAGCGGGPLASQTSPPATPAPTLRTSMTPPVSAAPSAVPVLRDGLIAPGTYVFVHESFCDDPCPAGATRPPALGIELTIPEGWMADTNTVRIYPAVGRERAARGESSLVMGWTSHWVGLNSEPCSQISHQPTDIKVGPAVDDFIEAVVAHPQLDTTEASDVSLGGYRGRFFSLTGPADLSGCEEWRPWDPGFYAQGPGNLWDVWVMDVNGFRILIVAEYFPDTPAEVKAELRQIAESIRFVP